MWLKSWCGCSYRDQMSMFYFHWNSKLRNLKPSKAFLLEYHSVITGFSTFHKLKFVNSIAKAVYLIFQFNVVLPTDHHIKVYPYNPDLESKVQQRQDVRIKGSASSLLSNTWACKQDRKTSLPKVSSITSLHPPLVLSWTLPSNAVWFWFFFY